MLYSILHTILSYHSSKPVSLPICFGAWNQTRDEREVSSGKYKLK